MAKNSRLGIDCIVLDAKVVMVCASTGYSFEEISNITYKLELDKRQ